MKTALVALKRPFCETLSPQIFLSVVFRSYYSATPTTTVGLSLGLGPAFTPASPGYVELPYHNYLAVAETQPLPGVAVALAAFVRVQRTAWFWQPELRYQDLTSTKFEIPGSGGGFGSLFSGSYTRTFHVRQVAASVLRGYSFGSRQQFYGFLGPALAFHLGNNTEPDPNPTTTPSQTARLDDAIDRAPATVQAQLQGGVGRWGRRVGLEVRYLYGLTPLVRHVTFDEQPYNFKVGSSALLLAVSYRFGGAKEE